MGGSRKPHHSGKLFRSPTDEALVSGNIDKNRCGIHIRTRLISVRTASSSAVREGLTLPVILQKLKSGPIAVVIDPRTKEPIGSLFPSEIDTLIVCLESGFKYDARVLEANGADILVEIFPALP